MVTAIITHIIIIPIKLQSPFWPESCVLGPGDFDQNLTNFENLFLHLEVSVVLFFGFSKPEKCFKICQNLSIFIFGRALPQAKIGLKSPQKLKKKSFLFSRCLFFSKLFIQFGGPTFFLAEKCFFFGLKFLCNWNRSRPWN